MGYYSTFQGNARRIDGKIMTDSELEVLVEQLEDISKYGLPSDFFEGGETDEIKWYDADTDLEKLSVKFPDYIFEVEQHGEDGCWRKMIACQGRSDSAAGHIVYDDLNEDYVIGNDCS